jgi:hypothetical protein
MRLPGRVIGKQLTCPARTLAAMQTLSRAIRTTPGRWVPAR